MWRIGALIAIWLFAAGILVLTKSRTAYLAAAFGAALVAADSVLRRNRFGWKLPLIAVMLPLVLVAVLVAVGVLVGGVDRLVLSESLKSFSYRIEYWRAAAAMIADHPLAGVGPGSFQSHYAAYKLPQASEMVLDPHNFALEIAASSGLPALVAFALLLVVKLGRTLVSRRLERDSEESDAAAIHSDMQDTEMLNSRIAGRSAMIGAAIGLLLAMPMAMLVRYPYDANGVMVAIVGVAVTLALLRRETFSLHLPTAVPLIGATVLLVNLLAASGIGSPGVAQSLWLLLAFVSGEGRGTSDRTTTNDGPEKRPALLRFVATAALAMLSITAWGAFLWLMYWPVMQGGVLFEEANVLLLQGSVGPAVQRYREAARVDPYSADPWQQIASLQHRRWVMFLANEADDARNDEARPAAVADQRADTTRHDGATESADERHRLEAEFRESADEMLRRLPHAHHAWRLYGVWLLAAYQQAASHPAPSDDWRADTERYGHDAEAAFVRAVELYPNHNYGHAELAWVRRKLGDNAGAASAAETALRLDALVPHSELQLKNRPFESDLDPDVPTTDVKSLLREWLGANDSAR